MLPWWYGFYLNEPSRRFRNPAQWRDTSDILKCHYLDDGWAGYISKDLWKTTPGMRALLAPFKTNIKVTFPGSALSITADLKARATALYAKHRALVIN